jgi:hypothetical protein
MSSQDFESRIAVAFPKSIPLSANFFQSYADVPRVNAHAKGRPANREKILIPFYQVSLEFVLATSISQSVR